MPTTAEIVHTGESLDYFKLKENVRRAELGILNRVNSIAEDAAFAGHLYALLPHVTWYSNIRCGKWYTSSSAPQAHFKSTDGHCHHWNVPWSRLNLHVAAAAAAFPKQNLRASEQTSVTTPSDSSESKCLSSEELTFTTDLDFSKKAMPFVERLRKLPLLEPKFASPNGCYSLDRLIREFWQTAPDEMLERIQQSSGFEALPMHAAPNAAQLTQCKLLSACRVGLIDSTRKGKRFPDAFSRTVPYWMAIVNRSVLRFLSSSEMTLSLFCHSGGIPIPSEVKAEVLQQTVANSFMQWFSALRARSSVEAVPSILGASDYYAEVVETPCQRKYSGCQLEIEHVLEWYTHLRVPRMVVSDLELSLMEQSADEGVDAFIKDCGPRMIPLALKFFTPAFSNDCEGQVQWKRLAGPLRPVWIHRESLLRDILTAEVGVDQQCARFEGSKYSLALLYSASRVEADPDNSARLSRTANVYVQGAGDDEENWAVWRPRYLQRLVAELFADVQLQDKDDLKHDADPDDDGYVFEGDETDPELADLVETSDPPEVKSAKVKRYQTLAKTSKRVVLTPGIFQENLEFLCTSKDNGDCLNRILTLWKRYLKAQIVEEFSPGGPSSSGDGAIKKHGFSLRHLPTIRVSVNRRTESESLRLSLNLRFAPTEVSLDHQELSDEDVVIIAASNKIKSMLAHGYIPSGTTASGTHLLAAIQAHNHDSPESGSTEVTELKRPKGDGFVQVLVPATAWRVVRRLAEHVYLPTETHESSPEHKEEQSRRSNVRLVSVNVPLGIGGKREHFVLYNTLSPILVAICTHLRTMFQQLEEKPRHQRQACTVLVTSDNVGLAVAIMTAIVAFFTQANIDQPCRFDDVDKFFTESRFERTPWMSELTNALHNPFVMGESVVQRRGSLQLPIFGCTLSGQQVKLALQHVLSQFSQYEFPSQGAGYDSAVRDMFDFSDAHPARVFIKQLNTYFCTQWQGE